MLGADGKVVDKRTLTSANKARSIVDASIRELTAYTGERPTIVRVKPRYYLVLTEVGWADAWTGIEVLPG